MDLMNLISTGIQADVYKEGDYAIKVFKEDTNKTAVLYEALISSRVEETGLNIPKIHEVSKIHGKWAITMDCIEGKTLYDIMKEDPDNKVKYLTDMLDLQLEIHSKRSHLLNKLKDKFKKHIENLDCIDNTRKYELLTRLDSMPKHVKLCHGDFGPKNILITPEQTYIVDWEDATQGNASADVAQTYLLLSLESPDAADLYLDLFCVKTNTAKRYVQQWLPIVAAARLSENIEEEKELLMKWIDVVDYE